jgi:hypothetical protein
LQIYSRFLGSSSVFKIIEEESDSSSIVRGPKRLVEINVFLSTRASILSLIDCSFLFFNFLAKTVFFSVVCFSNIFCLTGIITVIFYDFRFRVIVFFFCLCLYTISTGKIVLNITISIGFMNRQHRQVPRAQNLGKAKIFSTTFFFIFISILLL